MHMSESVLPEELLDYITRTVDVLDDKSASGIDRKSETTRISAVVRRLYQNITSSGREETVVRAVIEEADNVIHGIGHYLSAGCAEHTTRELKTGKRGEKRRVIHKPELMGG